jgi:hypothetical protein
MTAFEGEADLYDPRLDVYNDPKRTSLGNCVKAKDALPIGLHSDDNAAITAALRESWFSRQGGCTAALNAA